MHDPAPPSLRRTTTWPRLLVMVALAAGMVALVASKIDGPAFVAAVRGVAAWRLAAVAAGALVVMLLRGVRAQLLLPAGLSFTGVLSAVAVAFTLSLATPLRMGVVLRPWLLKRRVGLPLGKGVAGIVMERLLDLVVLLGLLLFVAASSLPAASGEGEHLRALTLGLGGSAVAGLGVIGLSAAMGPQLLDRHGGRLRRWGRVGGLIERLVRSFAEGARGIARAPLRTGLAFVVSLVMWGVGTVNAAVIMAAFPDVGAHWTRVTAFMAGTMTATATVPTPGSLGAFEAAGMAALSLYGVSATSGVAIAVLVHGLSLASQVALGVTFLWWEGKPVGTPPAVANDGDSR